MHHDGARVYNPGMGGLVIAVIAALIGVVFWAAVRGSAKRGAQQALDEHDRESGQKADAEPVDLSDVPPWERSRHLDG